MSRIGKVPVPIPDKIKVDIKGQTVKVSGPKGDLTHQVHPDIVVALVDNTVVVTRSSDVGKHRALHGLTRALINNMIIGVSEGYKIVLEMVGVGYRAEVKGSCLVLSLGYSHPVVISQPDGIKYEVEPKINKITVSGIDKQLVGQVAAKIRSFRKPEPYKGKGIRYRGEHVRSKAGKTAGSAA